MKKYAKDLKVGDTVYCVSDSEPVEKLKIKEVSADEHNVSIEYSNECLASCDAGDSYAGMGMYACVVFFNKEDAREYYRKLAERANRYSNF